MKKEKAYSPIRAFIQDCVVIENDKLGNERVSPKNTVYGRLFDDLKKRNGGRKEEEENKGSEENEGIASNHHAAENKQRNERLILLGNEWHKIDPYSV